MIRNGKWILALAVVCVAWTAGLSIKRASCAIQDQTRTPREAVNGAVLVVDDAGYLATGDAGASFTAEAGALMAGDAGASGLRGDDVRR